MLGDVVALNKLSLWFLTVKGTLVNINRQRESKATCPYLVAAFLTLSETFMLERKE